MAIDCHTHDVFRHFDIIPYSSFPDTLLYYGLVKKKAPEKPVSGLKIILEVPKSM